MKLHICVEQTVAVYCLHSSEGELNSRAREQVSVRACVCVCPCHEGIYRGCGKATLIFNLSTRQMFVINFLPQLLYPQEWTPEYF